MKVCLVGSSGGHLNHLYMLKPFWKDKDHFWVCRNPGKNCSGACCGGSTSIPT